MVSVTYTPQPPKLSKPMRTSSAADEALLLLVDDIRAGVYDVGAKLPPLKELGVQLGISHVNVSAAIERLAQAGVVAVQRGRGGGVTVIGLSQIPAVIGSLYHPLPPERLPELAEAWTILEGQVMVLASRRATPQDLALLGAKVQRLHVEATENPIEFAERTVQFHILAAVIADNEFLARSYSELLNQMSFVFAHQGYVPEMTSARRATTLEHFDRMIGAIAARNEDEIAAVVQERYLLQLQMMFGEAGAIRLGKRSPDLSIGKIERPT